MLPVELLCVQDNRFAGRSTEHIRSLALAVVVLSGVVISMLKSYRMYRLFRKTKVHVALAYHEMRVH